MSQTSNHQKTESKSSPVDTARRTEISYLVASLRALGVIFLVLGILTMVAYLFTSAGREYVSNLFVFFFTGENSLQLIAHVAGFFATIVLIGVLAVLATLLYLIISPTSSSEEGEVEQSPPKQLHKMIFRDHSKV
jgi:hypothetical protein